MFGINQLVQDRPLVQTLGQSAEGDAAQKDADAEANKRFWIGIAGGTLFGFATGFAAAKRGWL